VLGYCCRPRACAARRGCNGPDSLGHLAVRLVRNNQAGWMTQHPDEAGRQVVRELHDNDLHHVRRLLGNLSDRPPGGRSHEGQVPVHVEPIDGGHPAGPQEFQVG
jgi:hypothetical protein